MTKRRLLIGERSKIAPVGMIDVLAGLAYDDPEAWVEVATELGAFRDPRSKSKLSSIAVYLDEVGMRAVNLLPPSDSKTWPGAIARSIACVWWRYMNYYDVVYLAGRKVATAFGLCDAPLLSRWQRRDSLVDPDDLRDVIATHGTSCWALEEHERGATEIVIIPHPSGLSRWWNAEENVAVAFEELSRYGS